MAWIRGDLAKHLKDEKRGLQILIELQRMITSRIGWDNLAKKIGGVSHHTVEEYTRIFEGIFLGKTLYQFDFHKKRHNYRKAKKFYFIDSLVYFIIRSLGEKWSQVFPRSIEVVHHPPECGRLVEQVVCNHLARFLDDFFVENLGFFSNRREVDFLLLLDNKFYPIEVKFQETISERDFMSMKRLGFDEGILLTKNELTQLDGFVAIPLSIFLSTLDVSN